MFQQEYFIYVFAGGSQNADKETRGSDARRERNSQEKLSPLTKTASEEKFPQVNFFRQTCFCPKTFAQVKMSTTFPKFAVIEHLCMTTYCRFY